MAYELDICSCLEASYKRVAGSISDYQVYSFPEKCVHLYPDSRSALTPSDSLVCLWTGYHCCCHTLYTAAVVCSKCRVTPCTTIYKLCQQCALMLLCIHLRYLRSKSAPIRDTKAEGGNLDLKYLSYFWIDFQNSCAYHEANFQNFQNSPNFCIFDELWINIYKFS